MTDEELSDRFVAAVQARRYAMYHAALSYMKVPAEAEDAVSEAIEVTYSHLHTIRNPEAIQAYLMRAVINACRNQLRKKKREVVTDDMTPYDVGTEDESPLWTYLDHVPEKFRIPLLMRYGDGIPEQEIAKALHLPRGTISSRLARGLQYLREQM